MAISGSSLELNSQDSVFHKQKFAGVLIPVHCQKYAGFRILITLYRAKLSLPLICTYQKYRDCEQSKVIPASRHKGHPYT